MLWLPLNEDAGAGSIVWGRQQRFDRLPCDFSENVVSETGTLLPELAFDPVP